MFKNTPACGKKAGYSLGAGYAGGCRDCLISQIAACPDSYRERIKFFTEGCFIKITSQFL
jgi:hypothetical protein